MGCARTGVVRSRAGAGAVSPLMTDGGWCPVGRLGTWSEFTARSTVGGSVRLGGVHGRQARPSSVTGMTIYERTCTLWK